MAGSHGGAAARTNADRLRISASEAAAVRELAGRDLTAVNHIWKR